MIAISLIIDDGSGATSSTGQWNDATAANNHYGANSLYATVGGAVDTYRFTPDITIAGQYDVYVWNSCYNNRHTTVPHRIVHANGEMTVEIDQDCDSGSSGEWFWLGRYTFNLGTQGYLEISDQGLTAPSTTYIGADAVWFEEYNDGTPPLVDTEPPTVSMTSPSDGETVAGIIDVSANAVDNANVAGVQFYLDGNVLGAEDLSAPYSVPLNTLTLDNGSYNLSAVARDTTDNTAITASIEMTVSNVPLPSVSHFIDDFNTGDCNEIELLGPNYTVNNALSLPQVGKLCGRYYAELTDNTNNITLHYHNDQGRLDALLVSFPFEYIVRDIGIGTLADPLVAPTGSNNPYIFAGVQVHVADLNERNSSHIVVGHRGSTRYTIEGKNTLNGQSAVDDIGANTVPDGRADIRIVGNADHTLTAYWQTPNSNPSSTPDSWNLYRGTGNLPGVAPNYGAQVYVGLITYAFHSNGLPFVGTANSIEVTGEVTLVQLPVNIASLQPAISGTIQAGQLLISFSYIRSTGADNSLYSIEKSSNLNDWEVADENNGSITVNNNGDGTETVTWNSPIDAPVFIRVVVDNP